MWSRIIGKSNDAEDDRPAQTGRRKNVEQASKRHQSESTTSSNSARQKVSRADDRDRGFTPTSTSYASTTKNPYPNAASPSVAVSYSVGVNKTDEQYIPPGLVRNASLANQMPTTRAGRNERDRNHEHNGKSERGRERSLSRERKQSKKERPRSHDRGEKHREKKEKREKKDKDRVKDRGLSRSESGFRDEYGTSRALGDFNEQVGSAAFMQFPGQYNGGFVGGPQAPPAGISSHVQDQFPGQFPIQSSEPYRPPLAMSEGGPGLAAEYYGDAGQSVSDQPGVRLQSPSLIVGAEPHLQAASAVAAPPPEPSTTGGVGAAASFFTDSFTPEPIEGASSSQAPAGANGPSFYPQDSDTYTWSSTRPENTHHASSAPAIPTLGAATVGAAAGYFMSGSQPPQPQRPDHGSSAGIGYGASSSSTPQHPSPRLPSTSGPITNNSQPSKPGKHSSQSSNLPIYAAGAAGLAATAFQNNHQSSAPSYPSAQHHSTTSMVQQHRHRGPLSKFVDFFKDPEGVAQFEEYTEYIGVCRYCFAPGSSPRDAPRRHHYRRRRSNEHLGSSTRIDKESRYGSSDGEGRRRHKKTSLLATGVAGYGLSKVGGSLFNQKNDFDHTYSVKAGYPSSTHGTHGSHSPDRRSITSRGVTRRSSEAHSRRRSRSRSKERVEKRITRDGRVHQKDSQGSRLGGTGTTVHGSRHHPRTRSRSGSGGRKNGVAEAVLGAAVGSSVAAAGSRPRSRSPRKAFVRSKQRSREHSPDLPSVLRVSHPESHHGSHRSQNPPPSSQRHKSRKKEKKGGFFNFGNGSSSSSDATEFFSSGRERRRSSKKSNTKGKDDRNADVALMGLGAAAAALAFNGSRQGTDAKRISELVAGKESKGKLGRASHRELRHKEATMSGSEENMWESASEDGSDSGNSALAYGVPARRRSQESLSSESSGKGLWGWRWGSKKRAKDPTKVHRNNDDNNLSTTAGATTVELAGTAAAMSSIPRAGSHNTKMSTNSSGPLQLVHPVPTSDPSQFDITGANSMASSSQPIMYSRPGPVPIQHPRPIAPVLPAVYTAQVPYGHSYSVPAGPPATFPNLYQSQAPIPGNHRQAPFNTSQDGITGDFPPGGQSLHRDPVTNVVPRRRGTSPAAPSTETISKTTGARKRSSLKDDPSAVRFDLNKEQEDKGDRDYRQRSNDEEELQLQRERREKRRQEKEDEELRIQSERHEKRRLAKEEELRAESERWEAAKQKQIDKDRKAPREKSSTRSPAENEKSWATPATAGAIAAAVGAVVAVESSTKNTERDERREKRRGERESHGHETPRERRQKSPDEVSGQLHNADNQGSSIQAKEVASAPPTAPRTAKSGFEYEDYASFFSPPELSSSSREPKEHVANANADNDITAYQTPEIITREPAGIHSSSHSPAYSYAPDEIRSDHEFPSWVPRLNLIEPTPPASRASSTRGAPSPVIQPLEDIIEQEKEQITNSTTPSKVTWGESETREYTIITPMEQRDQFIDSPQRGTDSEEDVPEIQDRDDRSTRTENQSTKGGKADHEPGDYGNDLEFAATLAAGLEDTGFNPSIVIDDPVFRRRDSPPRSDKVGVAEESFIAEEANRQRQDLEKEVEDITRPTMPGSFDGAEEFEPILNKKDRKKREKAAKRHDIADIAVDQPIGQASRSRNIASAEPERLDEKPIDDTLDDYDDRHRSEKNTVLNSNETQRNGVGEPHTDIVSPSQKESAGEDSLDTSVSTSRDKKPKGREGKATGVLPNELPLSEESDSIERRVEPEPLENDGYDKKSKSKTHRSSEDLYESPSEDAPSIAASAPVGTDMGDGKKHKKKSKRSSSGHDDAASVASSPAVFDGNRDSKKSSKQEKGRKGGLFGLFGKSTDNLSEISPTKATPEGPTLDGFEEPKRKSKKESGDSKSSRNDEISSQLAGDDDRFKDEEEKTRSHKSRDKKEKRRTSGGSTAQDSGRITQDLPAKDRECSPSKDISRGNTNGKDEIQDEPQSLSFLGMRQEIPPSPNIPTATPKPPSHQTKTEAEILANVATYAMDDLALLEENRRTILSERERHGDLRSVPSSQPTSPLSKPGGKSRRLSEVRTLDSPKALATATSPTAVPFRWRELPPSPSFSRSSPSTLLSSLHQHPDVAPTRPKVRPRSTEFKSSTEFRPLWLVERHGSRQEPASEEVYPSLPSSHNTSRASSVHGQEDVDSIQDPGQDPTQHGLVIDTERATLQSDLLDSQEPTPTASSFQAAERGEKSLDHNEIQPSESADKNIPATHIEDNTRPASYSSERQLPGATDLSPHSRQGSPTRYNYEPSRDLPCTSESEVPQVPADNPKKDRASFVQKAAEMAAMVGGYAAVAMAVATHHDQPPEHSLSDFLDDQPWQDDRSPVSDINHPTTDLDHFQKADFSYKKPKKLKDKKRSKATSNQEETNLSTPTLESTSSQNLGRLDMVEQMKLQEQDAQDAVDSWFAPATPKKLKKDKKNKKERDTMDIVEQPRASTSDSVAPSRALTVASPIEDGLKLAEESSLDVIDDKEATLETSRHATDLTTDKPSAVPNPLKSVDYNVGILAGEGVDTMTALVQDTKTSEHGWINTDLPKNQPSVEDEWQGHGGKSKRKGKKNKKASVELREGIAREPQTTIVKSSDVDNTSNVAKQQDDLASSNEGLPGQALQAGVHGPEILNEKLELDAATETLEPSTLSKKKSRKGRRKAESMSQPGVSSETALGNPNQVSGSSDDEPDPSVASVRPQETIGDIALSNAQSGYSAVQNPDNGLASLGETKRGKKDWKNPPEAEEVKELDSVIPMVEQARTLDTETAEPRVRENDQTQGQHDPAADVVEPSSTGNEVEREHQESNDALTKMSTDPWVSPEAIPLPVDDDPAADVVEPSSTGNEVEREHQESNDALTKMSTDPWVSPEAIPLPVDDDLDIPNTSPEAIPLPIDDDLDIPDASPEAISLPTDDDLDLLDASPKATPLPVNDDLDLLDASPEAIPLPVDDDLDLLDVSPEATPLPVNDDLDLLDASPEAIPLPVDDIEFLDVLPEATPLPVDDDLDLLNALPESPLIIAANLDPGNLTEGSHILREAEHDGSPDLVDTVVRAWPSSNATPLAASPDPGQLEILPPSPVVKPANLTGKIARTSATEHQDLPSIAHVPQDSGTIDETPWEPSVQEENTGADDLCPLTTKKNGKKGKKNKQSLPVESNLDIALDGSPTSLPSDPVQALENSQRGDQSYKGAVEASEEQLLAGKSSGSSKKMKKERKQDLLAKASQSLGLGEKDLEILPANSEPVEGRSQPQNFADKQEREVPQEPLVEDEWAGFAEKKIKKGKKGKKQKSTAQEPTPAILESVKPAPYHLQRGLASDTSLVDLPERLPRSHDQGDQVNAGIEPTSSPNQALLVMENPSQGLPEPTELWSVNDDECALPTKKKKSKKGKRFNIQNSEDVRTAADIEDDNLVAGPPMATTDTAIEVQDILAESEKASASDEPHSESVGPLEPLARDTLSRPFKKDDIHLFNQITSSKIEGENGTRDSPILADEFDTEDVPQLPLEAVKYGFLPSAREPDAETSGEITLESSVDGISKRNALARTHSEPISMDTDIDQNSFAASALGPDVRSHPAVEEIEQSRAISPETAALLSRDEEKPPDALKAADIVPDPELVSPVPSESRPFFGQEQNTLGTPLDPIIEGQVFGIQEPHTASQAELSISEPANQTSDILGTAAGGQKSLDDPQIVSEHLPTLSKEDKKIAKSAKAAWGEDFDSSTPGSEIILRIDDIRTDVADESLGFPNDTHSKNVADEFESFSMGKKGKKKAKRTKGSARDDGLPMLTPESERVPIVGELREGFMDNILDFSAAAQDKVVADEVEDLQQNINNKTNAQKGNSFVADDNLLTPTPEAEVIPETTNAQKDIVDESTEMFAGKEAKADMGELTIAPKTKKDKKKAKKLKASSWEAEATTSTPEESKPQELITAREYPSVTPVNSDGPEELAKQKEADSIMENFNDPAKSEKNKEFRKANTLSPGDKSNSATFESITTQEPLELTDDPSKDQSIMEERTESLEPVTATQVVSPTNPFDDFPMSKKDKKKAKKKSKASPWDDENATAMPDPPGASESVVAPETLPQKIASATRDVREVEAEASQITPEQAVQQAIASTAVSPQHALDSITDSQAEQIVEQDPEIGVNFSIKKSKKDKKKAKKAQALNWDEDAAQAKAAQPTAQPTDESSFDTGLAMKPSAVIPEDSSAQPPQRGVDQEWGEMDFVQPFDEAHRVGERGAEDGSAELRVAPSGSSSDTRQYVLPIDREDNRIDKQSEKEHPSDIRPTENLSAAFGDDPHSNTPAHTLNEDDQPLTERAFDTPGDGVVNRDVTQATPANGQTNIGNSQTIDTADVPRMGNRNEDDGPWDVPVKKGRKGKKQRNGKSAALENAQVSEDPHASASEGGSTQLDPTTGAEQTELFEGMPVANRPDEVSELAVIHDYENPGNEKGLESFTSRISQPLEERHEPVLPLKDIKEVADQSSRSSAVETTSLPQDDFSAFTTTKKSKKGKKEKKKEAPIIWEDDTATQPFADDADEAVDNPIGPAPIPAPYPSEDSAQQINVREAEETQHVDEQPMQEQYADIPSVLEEPTGTAGEPSQHMNTSNDYFSISHDTKAKQIAEKGEMKFAEPDPGSIEQAFFTEPQEFQRSTRVFEVTDQAPETVGREREPGELPVHEEQAEADWDYAPAKKGKRGKKIKRKDVERETDNQPSGVHQVDEQSQGQATLSVSTAREGIAAATATAAGLGLGIIATEGLQRKDSGKAGKKGKKSKKASKWTEFGDEEVPQAIDQEKNGQTQAQAWTLEQQRAAVPPQHFEDILPLSPQVPHDTGAQGASFGGRSKQNVDRDSAIQVSGSPIVTEGLPNHRFVRDSGYHDTEISPVIDIDAEYETKTGKRDPRDADFDVVPFEQHHQSYQHDKASNENSFNVSVQTSPDCNVSIPQPTPEGVSSRSEDNDHVLPEKYRKNQGNRRSRDMSFDDLREPSPVSSTTKDRSSVLFQSSPSTREELAGQPEDVPTPPTRDGIAADYSSHEATRDLAAWSPNLHTEPAAVVAAERALHLTSPAHPTNEGPGSSLFGGPVGIISDITSPPRSPFSPDGSARRRLDTITEYGPEESPLHKKSRHLSDVGSPERGVKSLRRSARPQSLSQQRVRSPPVRENTPQTLISTDDLIARLSWPPVDEDKHAVDLERSRSRNTDHGHHITAPAAPWEGDRRSVSGASVRSADSINAIIRTPEQVRSVSGQSFRSSGTPPLRRVDHRVSGDLRLANKKSEAKLAKGLEAEDVEHDIAIPSSSTYDPIKDKGKSRVRDMADVHEGWGDVHGQSPISPTRPPSMRRRQSLQVLDLESKLDQLVSENRLLQNAKSIAERSLEEAAHARNSEIENYQSAIQTRDSFLSQKDVELNQLKNILEGLQSQVAQLTEVNEGLSATSRGIADHEQRYIQLQAEHANTHQQWQQSLIELDELRQQHSQLSAGMEDIVRHEVNVALEEKNLELRKVHDELEATKEQVRVLQRQILASKNSDELIIARDEDYFDDQCQKLCQHVQQWVLRFSKFSDMRACYLASEIRDEVVVDRFENAILDGSDVDSYLADRVKRRDVFMSVVMTMIFDYIFTRYLFGMDREQRQKLKSLQNILSEVGPMTAVHKWRATTLTLLSRRQAFVAQRAQDTEAVMEEIYKTLAKFLPPPSHLVNQIQDSLRKVIGAAVDLHIEMRTQRAEYVMLPPLQPEYDTNGDLARKVYFNAALMNERSGDTSSNDALEAQHAVVRMVLFPLVVKRGDDAGTGDEEIVVCPAQVLTAKPGKEKKTVRVMSVAGSTAGARSVASLGGNDVGMGNMI